VYGWSARRTPIGRHADQAVGSRNPVQFRKAQIVQVVSREVPFKWYTSGLNSGEHYIIWEIENQCCRYEVCEQDETPTIELTNPAAVMIIRTSGLIHECAPCMRAYPTSERGITMKAKEGVVNILNKILTADLTAINQYFVHAKMCENWGYERLHHKVRERSIDEMKDADELIGHILYLEGVPNMQRMNTVQVGETVPEQLKLDLKAEQGMLALLNEGIVHSTKVTDFTTRHMLEDMAKDVDGHIDWIETQLETIKQIGLENYLAEQIKKEGS